LSVINKGDVWFVACNVVKMFNIFYPLMIRQWTVPVCLKPRSLQLNRSLH